MDFIDKLENMHACKGACEWVGGKSLSEAWETCERGDWMLWLAVAVGVDRKKVVLAACECARLSLRYIPEGETRPLKAIQVAEAWVNGEASLEEVEQAGDAAYAVSVSAAYAAFAVVDVAGDASYAAASASSASSAYAASYASDSAWKSTMKQCADIVRKRILVEDIEEANEYLCIG